MAWIQVDLRTFSLVKRAIDEYCAYQDKQMRQLDFDIKSMLSSDWIGLDANEFRQKWAGVYAEDSQAGKFKSSLIEYGELLDDCAKIYHSAQISAMTEATVLIRSMNQ